MNTVTLSTAMRLKGAGFPQPNEATGQHWYKYETLFYITNSDGRGSVCAPIDEDFTSPRIFDKRDAIFAPTAIDIMLELGVEYVLWYDNGPKMTQWLCAKTGNTLREAGKPFLHKIAGEAAALAWLAAKSADNVRRPDDFDEFGE